MNPRPAVYKTAALPLSYVGVMGAKAYVVSFGAVDLGVDRTDFGAVVTKRSRTSLKLAKNCFFMVLRRACQRLL